VISLILYNPSSILAAALVTTVGCDWCAGKLLISLAGSAFDEPKGTSALVVDSDIFDDGSDLRSVLGLVKYRFILLCLLGFIAI